MESNCPHCDAPKVNPEKQMKCFECDKEFEQPLVSAAEALLSSRKTSFDEKSAYCEVVDNSVQADSSNVKIMMEHSNSLITRMIFGDDGCGMNEKILHSCLALGTSSRYNKRDSIGRFGVGLKLGAIHECRRIMIWSKPKDGIWNYVYLDLDEVSSGMMTSLPRPIPQKPPEEYADLAGKESGTLMIWEKYDAQKQTLSALRKIVPHTLGRTYRYFIWNKGSDGKPIANRTNPLKIYFNGELVKAHDPLYHTTSLTRFPNDLKSELYKPMKFPWVVNKVGLNSDQENIPDDSEVRIKFSLLPEKWRLQKTVSAQSSMMKDRYVNEDSRGFSIIRNNREVWFGIIPANHFNAGATEKPKWARWADLDRWWAAEISFEALLDDAFDVQNIKDGAIPTEEIRELIKSLLIPSRKSAIEEVKRVMNETQDKLEQLEIKEEEERKHSQAEKIVSQTPSAEPQLNKGKDWEEGLNEENKKRDLWAGKEQEAKIKGMFDEIDFQFIEKRHDSSKFFETSHFGGKALIEYNMNHPFFKELSRIKKQLVDPDSTKSDKRIAMELTLFIDLLIASYARSESNFSDDQKMTAQQFIDYLRNNWGQYLNSHMLSWQDKS